MTSSGRLFYGARWQSAAATPLSPFQKRPEIPAPRKSRCIKAASRPPSSRRSPYQTAPFFFIFLPPSSCLNT